MGAHETGGAGAGLAPELGPDGIEVRELSTLEEYRHCVELERAIWGGEDVDLVPSAMFMVIRKTGGQVLGALDTAAGRRMVGFTLAVAGLRAGRGYLHSHMTAVVHDYQNRGIGRRLKLYQRREALSRGIRLVEWTFDPLELRNAHFNLVRLGAIVRRYVPNCYGITTSPLHGGLPTDRLVAEWWLDSRRVQEVLGERERPVGRAQPPVAARIFIPATIAELRHRDPAAAAEIQSRARTEFLEGLGRGLAATGLETTTEGATYLLTPYEDSLTHPA